MVIAFFWLQGIMCRGNYLEKTLAMVLMVAHLSF